MGTKPSVKNQVVELLMDGQSYFSSVPGKVAGIEQCLIENEKLDHDNDKLTSEVIDFLIDALTAHSAKDYGTVETNIRSALQKINDQQKLDLKDDKPRTDSRVGLAELRCNAIHNEKAFQQLQERLGVKVKREK